MYMYENKYKIMRMNFFLFRVLRQIIQCLKPILDVLILLFFMMAIFALMGESMYACMHACTNELTFCPFLGYYLFATVDPTVCHVTIM